MGDLWSLDNVFLDSGAQGLLATAMAMFMREALPSTLTIPPQGGENWKDE